MLQHDINSLAGVIAESQTGEKCRELIYAYGTKVEPLDYSFLAGIVARRLLGSISNMEYSMYSEDNCTIRTESGGVAIDWHRSGKTISTKSIWLACINEYENSWIDEDLKYCHLKAKDTDIGHMYAYSHDPMGTNIHIGKSILSTALLHHQCSIIDTNKGRRIFCVIPGAIDYTVFQVSYEDIAETIASGKPIDICPENENDSWALWWNNAVLSFNSK